MWRWIHYNALGVNQGTLDGSMSAKIASSSDSTRPGLRFSLRGLLATFVLLAIVFAGYGWFYRRYVKPRYHNNQIGELIRSLATRRPANMTRGQWASAVAWTGLLHGNSLLLFEADGPTIEAFEQRLRKRLAGNVEMQTIDWIWDEYAELCPHGASYQRFKEIMQEEIDQVGPSDDPWGMKTP